MNKDWVQLVLLDDFGGHVAGSAAEDLDLLADVGLDGEAEIDELDSKE